MSKTRLFILLCFHISLIQCAAVLSDSSFSLFKHTSPPHVRLRSFKPLATAMEHTTAIPFKQKQEYFEKLSSSGQAEQKHNELIKHCKTIAKNQRPFDPYFKALDHQSYEQWISIAQKVADTPAQTIANNNDDNNLTYACKLAIYVSERLDFARISFEHAPFKFSSNPASFKRQAYLNAIEKELPENSDDNDHPDTAQCLWLANLCMALEYSLYDDHTQDAFAILSAFNIALEKLQSQKITPIDRPITLSTLLTRLEELAKMAENHGCPPTHLAFFYHNAFSRELICQNTAKTCYINPKLGYLAQLMQRFSTHKAPTCLDNQKPLSIELIHKYLGLYQ